MDTFIIRVVPGDPSLRGVLRRVADGSEATFTDGAGLLALLDDWRRPHHDDDRADDVPDSQR